MVETGPTVLVTGATGAVGPALLERLAGRGFALRALIRRPEQAARLPAGVAGVAGDVTEPADLLRATAGVDAVVHLAARLHVNRPGADLDAAYRRVNVDGVHHLVEACRANGVAHLVFFSTINVYGPGDGRQVFTEESSPRPTGLYAETKAAGEAIALGLRDAAGRPLATVLRPAAVYGRRMKGNYRRLLKAAARGYYIPIGAGQNRRTLIFDEDLAAAVDCVLRQPRAKGEIYNVTDGQIHTMRTIEEALYAAVRRNRPPLVIPAPLAHAAGRLVEFPFRALGRKSPPVGRFTIEKLLEDIAVSGEKIQTELGFQPAVSLREGWRAVADGLLPE